MKKVINWIVGIIAVAAIIALVLVLVLNGQNKPETNIETKVAYWGIKDGVLTISNKEVDAEYKG